MSTTPTRIGDLALLSDCVRAALVSARGSIEWCCPTRFDGPSLFGRLLDPDGGHWTVTAAGPRATTRRYLPDSMVHEVVFDTVTGRLVLTDALVAAGDLHDESFRPPGHLVRHLRVESGEVDVAVELCPRPLYATASPCLRAAGPGRLDGRGFSVTGDVPLAPDRDG